MTRAQLIALKSGYLTSSKDFDDYAIVSGEKYKIKTADWGAFIHTNDTVNLDNNEITDEVLEYLTWEEE